MATGALRRLRPGQGSFRYVIFPPAGASSATCAPLGRAGALGEVWAVEYPGRGTCSGVPPADSLTGIAGEVARELSGAGHPLPSTVLVGISMGAFVAFEVTRRLPAPPAALVVVSAGAPDHNRLPATEPADAELLQMVEDGRLLRADPRMREYALRTLRADLRITSAYTGPGHPVQLACDLLVMHGADDPRMSEEAAQSWRAYSGGRFATRSLPGPHLGLLTDLGCRAFWQALTALAAEGFVVAHRGPAFLPAVRPPASAADQSLNWWMWVAS